MNLKIAKAFYLITIAESPSLAIHVLEFSWGYVLIKKCGCFACKKFSNIIKLFAFYK